MDITEGKPIELPGLPAGVQAFEGDDWVALYDGKRHVATKKPIYADFVADALRTLAQRSAMYHAPEFAFRS